MLKKVMIPLALLILSSIIAFWTQSPTFAAPGQQSPLPAPGAEAAELAELIDRIAALEAQVAALEEHAAAHQAATVPAGQVNRVTTAIYLLDNAGLHDLDVRLNEEGEILPGDAGQIARLSRLLSAVDWPEALAGNAEALITTLGDLQAALAGDDAEAAAPLAFDVHEIGHTLSHDAEHWLGEALGAGHGHSDDEDSGDEHGAESEETGDAADDESGD